MQWKRTVAVVSLLAVLAVGCITSAKDFPTGNVYRIKKGLTSRAEILEWFGEPYQQGLDGGTPTWKYQYYKRGIGYEYQKDLQLYFDDRGIVNDFTFSTNFPGESYGK